MAFNTVGEVVTQARVLLQDTEQGAYRYPTVDIYQALNEGLLESARFRPDFYRGLAVPQYAYTDSDDDIDYPDLFIPTLINYIIGRVQLRDDEATTDARAGAFLTSFKQTLTTL